MPIKPALQAQFEQQFKSQTPIQAAVWEKLTQGDNIFGLAPTGTGKTLAFLLPMLSRINPQVKQTQVFDFSTESRTCHANNRCCPGMGCL